MQLGIDQTVSAPMMPTDRRAIGIQGYDANNVRHNFTDLLRARGFEVRLANLQTQGHEIEVFWVKRNKSTG